MDDRVEKRYYLLVTLVFKGFDIRRPLVKPGKSIYTLRHHKWLRTVHVS